MTPLLGLSALTVLDTAPMEHIRLAEKHGFDTIGIRLLPASPGTLAYPLHREPRGLRDLVLRLADSPVTIFDLEIVRLDRDFRVSDYEQFAAAGAQLGARAVLVAGDDENRSRLADSYSQFADLCSEYTLVASLEFMPWTAVPDARAAIEIVSQSSGPGRSILVDALHADRSATTLHDLAAIPCEWLHYAQVCDGSVPAPEDDADLIRHAREERLLPGSGGIDLTAIWSTLPADLPVSIEVPNEYHRHKLGTDLWLDKLLEATKTLLRDDHSRA